MAWTLINTTFCYTTMNKFADPLDNTFAQALWPRKESFLESETVKKCGWRDLQQEVYVTIDSCEISRGKYGMSIIFTMETQILHPIPKNSRRASRKMHDTLNLKQLEQRYKLACNKIDDCKKYANETFEKTIHRDFHQLYKNIDE